MRIYEIVTEYRDGRELLVRDRFRVACNTFAQALKFTERKISGKKTRIQSICIVADTEL